MTGRNIGLAIGINDYLDPKLSYLRFAKKDAEDMRTVLLNPDIGVFDEIVPLINETKYNVKKGIEKLLLKDATSDDLVIIYFSGHGKLDFKFELNLLLKDTETDYLMSTALNYNFITDCIEQSKCKKVVIILDCCHGGAAGIKGDILKALSETSGSGTFILSATTGSNMAKEVQELENGIFTHFLLEGLRKGDADLDGDGSIDILELYEYASKKCNDKYSQVATIKTTFEKKIVIGKNPLKIREKDYELKKSRLLEDFVFQLPPRVLDESLTILRKNYKNPSSFEKVEIDILRLLESFLEGELSVDNYIIAVQHLKKISINVSTPLIENWDSVLKVEVPDIGNTEVHETSENSVLKAKYRYGSWSTVSKPEVPTIRDTGSYEISEKSYISKTFLSPSTSMEFILIPAGKFMMGSQKSVGSLQFLKDILKSSEFPIHEVIIKYSFYLGKVPITQKQWIDVMGYNPFQYKNEAHPVERVSWNDAQEFIKRLNEIEETDKYRLPSEAEWEYACRAGTQTMYSFGDDHSNMGNYAWYHSYSGTHPVGQKKPNPWGLYDMHGNVSEWVQDNWHLNYNDAPSDGSAWENRDGSDRVRRGGSCADFPGYCRSASRLNASLETRARYVGFRLLREL